jgi:antitoxin (DNA-binding transcriptional repressor) of toxin-antitoxin stability system
MRTRISATAAARGFSELLNRVHYRGVSFIIERGGKPVGELRPAPPAPFRGADFVRLLESLPHPGGEYLDEVEELVNSQPPVSSITASE